ncbi:adenine phosphoribosyltransferase [Tomitella cavernea]|uniref:adenine phosphoribosyltransferase n=1 Tax=Tomitella cavernea TaxID=1387982 RepID=UPI0027DB3104|nr:adenine phosphoribosyltransferase [Tomitella cavernea]
MDGTELTAPEPLDARAEVAAAVEGIRRLARHVSDFPQPGVLFTDLTPVFADGPALRSIMRALAAPVAGRVDLVAGIDARGFLLGAGVALELGTGVLAVRKKGKLPPPVHGEEYALEYGSAALEVPAEAIELAGRRVLVVDDVLATGGTLRASVDLLERCGAIVETVAVVAEVPGLGGRERLDGVGLHCLTTV